MPDKLLRSFKERLSMGENVIGTFLFIPSPDVAEAVARTGVDFVIIDMEHSPKSWQTVSEMVRGAQYGGAACLVRVASKEPTDILHALEIGADGIVLPFIEDALDVSRALEAARYSPLGRRGVCTMSRAGPSQMSMVRAV
jgi:4-hydroxy-2-oxoheptanedioate aldolase